MNISTNYNSPIVAVACSTSYKTIEGQLSIYDLKEGRREREFPVRFDAGGHRLALSKENEQCFVGCYKVHGLAAYSALDGSQFWRRKEFNAIQSVVAFPSKDIVFCGRGKEGDGLLLSGNTGETLENLGDVESVYPSSFGDFTVVSAEALDLHSPLGTRIGKINRTTFAELDCCFSDSEVLVTESGGCVRCFHLASVELLWTHHPKTGSHFLNLCFSQALERFVGILWHYEDSTDPLIRVVHFERRTGEVLKEVAIGTPGRHEFCLAGSAIFTSDLRLISVESGSAMRDFAPSAN